MNRLESVLRDYCRLIDWHPTPAQLYSIAHEIDYEINSGKVISRTVCQNIISRHCGVTKVFLTDGVDNSDLNVLLTIAIKSMEGKSE